MDPHTYGQLNVYNDEKATQWRRIVFLRSAGGKIG